MCTHDNCPQTDAEAFVNLSSSRGCLYELGIDYGILIGLANFTLNGQWLVNLFREEWNDAPGMNQSFYDIRKILTHYHIISPNDSCTDDELGHQFREFSISGYDMITSFLRACMGQEDRNPFHETAPKKDLEVVYAQLGLYNLFGDQGAAWVRDTQRNLLLRQLHHAFPEENIVFSDEEAKYYAGKGRFLNADTLVLVRDRRDFAGMTPRYYLFVSDESGYTSDVLMDITTEEAVYQQMAAICNHSKMQSLFRNASVYSSKYDGIDMKNIDRFSRDKSLNKCMQAASYGCSFYEFLQSKGITGSSQMRKISHAAFCGMTNVDYATINLQNPEEEDLAQFAGLYKAQDTVPWDIKIKNQEEAFRPKMNGAFVKKEKEGDWDVFCTTLSGTDHYSPGSGTYRITDNSVRKEHTDLILKALENTNTSEFLLLAAPGIGKTYSIRKYIRNKGKGIFVYISPRIAITQEVAAAVEKDYGNNGIVLTTDSRMGNGNICAGSNLFSIQKAQAAAGMDKDGNPYHLLTGKEAEEKRDFFQAAYSIESWTCNSGVMKENRKQERVLDRLCGCAGNIAAYQQKLYSEGKPQDLSSIMLGISTQACGKISADSLKRNISQIFGIPDLISSVINKNRKEPLADSDVEAFLQTFGNVTFMVDEISGDEGGLQIRKALKNICRQVSRCSNNRIVPKLIIADASMQDKTTARKYLGAATPEAVFMNPAEHHDHYLYEEPMETNCTIINCCTYPARNLHISYKANIQGKDCLDQDGMKSYLRKILDDVIAVCRPKNGEREELLCEDGIKRRSQCLVYIQNRADLGQIKSYLETPHEHCNPPIRCMELTSDTCARDKAKTQETANSTDAPEVLLITSSGARGLSFKYVTHLFVQIPTFSICSNMMEIMQTIYRGRGDQAIDSGCDKEITFYLDLSYTKLEWKGLTEDEKKELRKQKLQFHRQKRVDMMSMLLLMQGCIETRILGYDRMTEYSVTPLGRQGYTAMSSESIVDLDKDIGKLENFMNMEKGESFRVINRVTDIARAQSGSQYEIPSKIDFLEKWNRYAETSLMKNGHPGTIPPFAVVNGCIIFSTTVEDIRRSQSECNLTSEEKKQIKQIIGNHQMQGCYLTALRNVMNFIDKSSDSFDRAYDLDISSGRSYFLVIPLSALGKPWAQNRWADMYDEQGMDIINCMITGLRQFSSVESFFPLTAEHGFKDVPFLFFSSADFEKRLGTRFVNTELVTSTNINLLSLIFGSEK